MVGSVCCRMNKKTHASRKKKSATGQMTPLVCYPNSSQVFTGGNVVHSGKNVEAYEIKWLFDYVPEEEVSSEDQRRVYAPTYTCPQVLEV